MKVVAEATEKARKSESDAFLDSVGAVGKQRRAFGGTPADMKRWDEFLRLHVIEECKVELGLSTVDFLTEVIDTLRPVGWEVFFWMREFWRQVGEHSQTGLRTLRLEEALQAEATKQQARSSKGGLKKAEKKAAAKAFVQAEWEKHRVHYSHNKSAFALDYVGRLNNEYSVRITANTITESWLPRLKNMKTSSPK